MFHDFFQWLQEDLGADICHDGSSWSLQYHGSLNLWGLTEGTHVMTLILFAGTILLVDLRLLGVLFREVPFSKLNDKVLPLTIAGFGIMIVTGVLLFLAKPEDYYHSIWFRLKMIFLVIASLNIFWFHFKVQKNQAEWDDQPSPPAGARLSAAISLSSWILIILFGRFIAYNWFDADKMRSAIEMSVRDRLTPAHQVAAGPGVLEGFFRTAYAFCECDKSAGPAPTVASVRLAMEHPDQVPETAINIAVAQHAAARAALVAKTCPAEPAPAAAAAPASTTKGT